MTYLSQLSSLWEISYSELLPACEMGVNGKNLALCYGSRCEVLQAHCRHLLSWRENNSSVDPLGTSLAFIIIPEETERNCLFYSHVHKEAGRFISNIRT